MATGIKILSDILSKAQEDVTSMQQKTASSTKATQEGSTITPETTKTPKVSSTAKAMPSVKDLLRITPQTIGLKRTGTSVVETPKEETINPKELLSPIINKSPLKASAPDMLDGKINDTGISGIINKYLYEIPQKKTQELGKSIAESEFGKNVINLFNVGATEIGRWGISSIQGWLEKFGDRPLVGVPLYVQDEGMFKEIKEDRNKIYEDMFNILEERDQGLSYTGTEGGKKYEKSKKTSEEWAAEGKGVWEAMQEGRRDIVTTRWGEIFGQMAPAFAVSLLTKNPKAAATTIFTTTYGSSYKDELTNVLKDPQYEHLTLEQKKNLASLLAFTEAIIETAGDVLELAPFLKGKLSFSRMFGLKSALASFVVNWQGSAATESVEEGLSYIFETLIKQAYGSLDELSLKELWNTVRDTYLLMQLPGLGGGMGGAFEVRNRNRIVSSLKNEADRYEDYNEFEADAQRAGVEDNEIIQEAWAESKGLTKEQTQILKYDINYVEGLENEATQLYNEKDNTEAGLESLRNNPEENEEQIKKLETRLQEIDNRIEEINNSIQEYMDLYGENTEEELPATKQEQQLPSEEGGENLSEQSMGSIDQGEVSVGEWDIEESKKSFDKSIDQIKNGTEYYNTQFARDYAYATSGQYRIGDTEQNQKMINKVQSLLSGVGIKIRFRDSLGGTRGAYSGGVVYYKKGNKELTLYGHEVFHAMMDVIKNGKLDDVQLQRELQNILNQAIEDVKKQFGIDGYKSGIELEYANKFAEEWLANSFGEYLANREINGPKTFVQKIIDFFNQILDLFRGNKKTSLNKQLKKAFDKIAEGEITGRRGIPTMVSTLMASPIESSTDITQEDMAEEKGEEYTNLVKENQIQTEQQQELGEHYEDILDAGKESKKDNEIFNTSNDTPAMESTSELQTTAQTVRDIFGKDKKKQIKSFSIMKNEVSNAWKDVMTPAMSRIYNISPRVAGRLVQMETQRGINIYRYRERAKPFVEKVSKLDKNAKLEVKKALLDYGALAYEQGENIEQYKKDEVKKLKETLNKYGITNEMIDDTIGVLNELGQKYKDAGLSITLSDMYFPRTVIDYEGLSNYISEKTGIEGKEKDNLLNRIAKIKRNDSLTDEEKEKQIRRLLTVDYKEPGTTSKHAKERKMGLLSEWGEGIYQFYADPMESLDNYIVNMENAIQRQLFLGGLQEEAGLKGENVSMTEIVEGLVDEGKISNEDLEELKKSVLSVLDKKPTPKVVSGLKNFTYVATLANFLSAINQLDDLAVVIIKNKSGLKNIVKTIAGKAGIKYNDLGLEDAYEMFRGTGKLTNWFFKASWFNTIDRLGKTAFINTAWDSLVRQAEKNSDGSDTVARENLKKRLEDMYGKETAEHIMEKIDSGDYMTNGQIDIDVLTDLLYQLGSTQPIYTSAMPTAYLNNPWVRLCYALQSFTIKRIDMLVQGFKEVYRNNGGGAKGFTMASSRLMGVSVFLSLFGVAIGDLQDWLKGEEDETVLWKLMNEGIDSALKEVWNEGKASWLKIWNLSLYDKKAYDRDGLWGIIMNKVKPPMISIGKNFLDAITEHNMDEATDLIQYIPLIGKILYYQFFDEMYKNTLKLNLDDFELNLDDIKLNLDDIELNLDDLDLNL